nr:hypothetical protein [Tanacetum cinerariifolium]
MTLTFADTHNMIAYLTKSDASEEFDQIIDFLNASSIKYALTKKVIITEATIQEALRLDDAESIDCSPNDEIFTELSRMGYEKPSTKLTFYKAFFLQQWKFLIHTILQCMSAKRTSWNKFSSSMALDVFCLSTVVVGVDVDVVPAAAAAKPSIPSPTPTTQPPPPSQELPSTSQVISTPPPSPIVEPSPTPQQQQPSQPTHDAEILLDLLHTLLETCTTLTRVKKLERKNKLKVSGLRRLRKVGTTQRIESSVDIVMDDQEDASKHGEIIANIDADEDVTLKDVVAIEKSAEIKENADVQRRLEESQANIYKIDLEHADKVLSMHDDNAIITAATTPITVATITAAPKKTKEQLEKEKSRALKRKTKSQAEKATKKQKLDEEVEELKKHLQIVPNDEDDV